MLVGKQVAVGTQSLAQSLQRSVWIMEMMQGIFGEKQVKAAGAEWRVHGVGTDVLNFLGDRGGMVCRNRKCAMADVHANDVNPLIRGFQSKLAATTSYVQGALAAKSSKRIKHFLSQMVGPDPVAARPVAFVRFKHSADVVRWMCAFLADVQN